LCSVSGVTVTQYVDNAEGTMVEEADGGGRFTSVVLKPQVTVKRGADLAKARELHAAAHNMCFIARSVNFPVGHEPSIVEECYARLARDRSAAGSQSDSQCG